MSEEKPRFTLGYWSIRGLAQSCRIALWYIGQKDFENKEYATIKNDDGTYDRSGWKNEKFQLGFDFPNLPYVIDRKRDVKITQSMAVLRYICSQAENSDLVNGSGPLADKVEMLAWQSMDLRNALVGICYGASAPEHVETFKSEKLPPILEQWELYLKNERPGKFLIGPLCYVDFFLAEHLHQLTCLFPKCLDNYPNLVQYTKDFYELPEVQEFSSSQYHRESPCNAPMAFVNN